MDIPSVQLNSGFLVRGAQDVVTSTVEYVDRLLSSIGILPLGMRHMLSIVLAPAALVYLWRTRQIPMDGKPPIVSHLIPWFGSALGIQKNPDELLRKARRELGPVFGVKVFGMTMYHVADADLITAVYQQPHVFSASPMQATFLNIVYGVRTEVITGSNALVEAVDSFHRQFSPSHFKPLLSAFIVHARSQIHKLPSQTSISLVSATVKPIQNADCAMLFGASFLNRYNRAVEAEFETFETGVPLLAVGFPGYFLSKVIAARKILTDTLEAYFEAGLPDDASELLKEFVEIGQSHDWTPRDLAAFGLGIMWPLLSNAPYAVYWLLVLHLHRPEGLAPLIREIDSVIEAGRDLDDVVSDSNATPYLDACVDETIRLASDSYSVRWIAEGHGVEQARLGAYVFKPGDQVICSTRSAHMDEEAYANPGKFEPERFLGGQKDKLRGRFIPFGGGFSVCSGRYLATTQVKAFIITLLSEFEVTLEGGGKGVPAFSPSNRGFGMIRPIGDVRVRLAKRKPTLTQTRVVESPVEFY